MKKPTFRFKKPYINDYEQREKYSLILEQNCVDYVSLKDILDIVKSKIPNDDFDNVYVAVDCDCTELYVYYKTIVPSNMEQYKKDIEIYNAHYNEYLKQLEEYKLSEADVIKNEIKKLQKKLLKIDNEQ